MCHEKCGGCGFDIKTRCLAGEMVATQLLSICSKMTLGVTIAILSIRNRIPALLLSDN
jgi:hypothetical protein